MGIPLHVFSPMWALRFLLRFDDLVQLKAQQTLLSRELAETKKYLVRHAAEVDEANRRYAAAQVVVEKLRAEASRQETALKDLLRRTETLEHELEAARQELEGVHRKPAGTEGCSTHRVAKSGEADGLPTAGHDPGEEPCAPVARPASELQNARDRTESLPGRNPCDNGGGPRAAIAGSGEGGGTSGPKRARATLLARRDSHRWQLYIECDEAPREAGDPELSMLSGCADIREGIFGPIENPQEIFSRRPWEPPLIFRVTGEDTARLARSHSQGLYFALVPSTWSLLRPPQAPSPLEPEDFGIPGYRMHFFSQDRGLPLVFEGPGGELYNVNETTYRLEGDVLPDADERMGPCFIREPPELTNEAGGIDQVRTVVIGEEGPGKGRWRDSISLPQSGGWGNLIRELLQHRRVGWYFLRLYDDQSHLITSLAFRYAPGLQACKVTDVSTGRTGPALSSVQFDHDETIQLISQDNLPLCGRERNSTGDSVQSTFRWTPEPRIRTLRFEVSDGTGRVPIKIDVDRLWWRLLNGGRGLKHESEWQADTLPVAGANFGATSDAELQIRLPGALAHSAQVGFDAQAARPIHTSGEDGSASVQLYQFSEAPQLTRPGENPFSLWWTDRAGLRRQDLLAVSVLAPCRWCDARALTVGQLLEHVLKAHENEVFEKRPAHRGNQIAPRNPRVAYVCHECGWVYMDTRPPEQGRGAVIYGHFRDCHPGFPVYFRTYLKPGDIDRIMQLHCIWKCRLGSCEGIEATQADPEAVAEKLAHLRQHHLPSLCAAS